MIIGTLRLRLYISEATSLKGKRFYLKSLKDRLRRKFNISITEIGEKDLWQTAELAVAIAGDDTRYLNRVLDQVRNQIADVPAIEITDSLMEFF